MITYKFVCAAEFSNGYVPKSLHTTDWRYFKAYTDAGENLINAIQSFEAFIKVLKGKVELETFKIKQQEKFIDDDLYSGIEFLDNLRDFFYETFRNVLIYTEPIL